MCRRSSMQRFPGRPPGKSGQHSMNRRTLRRGTPLPEERSASRKTRRREGPGSAGSIGASFGRSRSVAPPRSAGTAIAVTSARSRPSPNHRLVDVPDDTVSFRWKDYRHCSQLRTLTLDVDEFLRRFLLHVLPKRFVCIRYFGFLASRCRNGLPPECADFGQPVVGDHCAIGSSQM